MRYLTIVTIALLSLVVSAQETKEAKIERLLALTSSDATLREMMNQLKTNLKAEDPKAGTTAETAKTREIQQKMFDLIAAQMNQRDFHRQMVTAYDETFSEAEIDGMLTFFESAPGRAMQQKMPQLTGRLMALSMAETRKLMPEIERLAREGAVTVKSDLGGRPAADFKLTDLSGRQYQLTSVHGKVVLVDFLASWCEPCRAEVPLIEKLHREYKDLIVWGIDSGESAEVVKKFVRENEITYPVLLSPDKRLIDEYGAHDLPTTVIIDKDGKILQHSVGYSAEVDEPLRAAVAGAMLTGEWLNQNPKTLSITRVEIATAGGQIRVHMWGKCHPADCDWGEARAESSAGPLRVSWNHGFAIVEQELVMRQDGALQITSHTHVTDQSGRPDTAETEYFSRKPSLQ